MHIWYVHTCQNNKVILKTGPDKTKWIGCVIYVQRNDINMTFLATNYVQFFS